MTLSSRQSSFFIDALRFLIFSIGNCLLLLLILSGLLNPISAIKYHLESNPWNDSGKEIRFVVEIIEYNSYKLEVSTGEVNRIFLSDNELRNFFVANDQNHQDSVNGFRFGKVIASSESPTRHQYVIVTSRKKWLPVLGQVDNHDMYIVDKSGKIQLMIKRSTIIRSTPIEILGFSTSIRKIELTFYFFLMLNILFFNKFIRAKENYKKILLALLIVSPIYFCCFMSYIISFYIS